MTSTSIDYSSEHKCVVAIIHYVVTTPCFRIGGFPSVRLIVVVAAGAVDVVWTSVDVIALLSHSCPVMFSGSGSIVQFVIVGLRSCEMQSVRIILC